MINIQTKDLVKIYQMGENKVFALNKISLDIQQGEFIAITGASGSGKSTLMHVLGCLDIATSGDYILDGKPVGQATKDELAKIRNEKIGFVFQKFYLLSDLTAVDNVALPQLYAGVKESVARENAKKMLMLVNLADRLNHYPHQLSGGQQQRVAIARSLINNPKIIFADEPTGNLDTATGNTIMDLFIKLNDEKKVTTIIVTHEADIAIKTKRIIELLDGKIISDRKIN